MFFYKNIFSFALYSHIKNSSTMKLFKLITLAVAMVLVATLFSCNGAEAGKDAQKDSTAVEQNDAKAVEEKVEETVAQADSTVKDSVAVVAEEEKTEDKAAE